MKLDTPFYHLPLRFDAEQLAREVSQFGESEWRKHPEGHKGNSALPLIAAGGNPDDDSVRGPMRPTPFLDRCPYLKQVLASLHAVLGRTRLMRIVGHGEATPHVDTNYYWMQHVRVHIPAITTPGVQFICDNKTVHMAPGECWIFDTWRLHNVINPADASRIHLVTDTVGSAAFWDLVDGAERPFDPRPEQVEPATFVPFQPGQEPELAFETFNFPVVMSPWEQECLIADLLEPLFLAEEIDPEVLDLQAFLVRFNKQWRALWARFTDAQPGWAIFEAARKNLLAELAAWQGKIRLPNNVDLVEALMQGIVRPALNPDLAMTVQPVPTAKDRMPPPPSGPSNNLPPPPTQGEVQKAASRPETKPLFDRPVIIVAAPRSGSSLLFETLARSPDFWTVGGESHELFEGIASLNPANRGFDSNRLLPADATPQVVEALKANFLANLRDRENRRLPVGASAIRLLEKTPKNALRIPFLDAVFPDALFVYLQRDPRDNISSIMDAWRSGRFVTYPRLPGWEGLPWSLLLVPGWRDLNKQPLEEIAAQQWRATHELILADLAKIPRQRWTTVSHEEFVARPRETMERLCAFAGVRWDDPLDKPLPNSRHTLTPPDPDKWKRNAAELERVLPKVETMAQQLRDLTKGDSIPATPALAEKTDLKDQPLRSVATNNFAPLLSSLGISLAVSTYQAGKLILVRADGSALNTHFRAFNQPMGLALRGNRLAIGAGHQVWHFQNQPEVARKLEPTDKHDACFLPRQSHYTGDIRVHEIAFAGSELWIVNTRFSCLCTLDAEYSFVPRWRPAFVTALTPEDRCHLNGLGMRDGKPRYVTCLGATDTAGGWRENKRNGGLLMDITTGKVMLAGLSMPHSPRWYQDRLWVLESGEGSISYLDPSTNTLKMAAQMPGFTRGVDFHGHLAFIGLSQVRESAVFSGLPLTDRLPESERACGVWVVDLRDGKVVAFLRFESGVQEIFAVQVLPNIRFPELLNESEEQLLQSFVLPDEALAQVPGHKPPPPAPTPAPTPAPIRPQILGKKRRR